MKDAPSDHTIAISTIQPPVPAPDPTELNASLRETNNVLELTSLNSNGGQPARIANLNYSNVVTNTNLGSQNAVANQQAHAQVALSTVGKAISKLMNLGPREARASVDVLTDNAEADTIASLQAAVQAFSGGGSGPAPQPLRPGFMRKLLELLRHRLAEIERRNARLQGSGTYDDPYRIVDNGPLFVRQPITIGFRGVTPSQVTLRPSQRKNEVFIGS